MSARTAPRAPSAAASAAQPCREAALPAPGLQPPIGGPSARPPCQKLPLGEDASAPKGCQRPSKFSCSAGRCFSTDRCFTGGPRRHRSPSSSSLCSSPRWLDRSGCDQEDLAWLAGTGAAEDDEADGWPNRSPLPRMRLLSFANMCVVSVPMPRISLRSSMTSFTVAVLEPRSCKTTSMKSEKLNESILVPVESRKIFSAQSTSAMTSTPTSRSARQAWAFSRMPANSVLEMRRSPSVSSCSTMFIILPFT
mmetsp:Transcript_23263/g.66132  ORF Transcript_23263/g.66132 Transcript_23263/m.66132 type:complete len:251 (+) Transcript_23263:326-1078(+)